MQRSSLRFSSPRCETEPPRPAGRRRSRCFPAVACVAIGLLAVGCSQDAEQRRSEIYELKARPTEKNLGKIRELLADVDRDVRATALNALVGAAVPDAAELALRGLDDEDGFVRSIAAKLLGDVGDPHHAPALGRRLVEDADPKVRQRAAESLARLGGEVALQALIRGLDDPIEPVRLAVVQGLRGLDPQQAQAALTRILREDPAWQIRAQAAQALGAAGSPEALDALRRALDDSNEFVRTAAAQALRLHGLAEPDGG